MISSPAFRALLRDAVFLLALATAAGLAHHAMASDRPLFVAPVDPAFAKLVRWTAIQTRRALETPGVIAVDARPREAFVGGTLPGSLSLPLHGSLGDEALAPLRSARQVVVFCSNLHCNASEQMAVKLIARGVSNVVIFPGGFAEWQRLGYPVARP